MKLLNGSGGSMMQQQSTDTNQTWLQTVCSLLLSDKRVFDGCRLCLQLTTTSARPPCASATGRQLTASPAPSTTSTTRTWIPKSTASTESHEQRAEHSEAFNSRVQDVWLWKLEIKQEVLRWCLWMWTTPVWPSDVAAAPVAAFRWRKKLWRVRLWSKVKEQNRNICFCITCATQIIRSRDERQSPSAKTNTSPIPGM